MDDDLDPTVAERILGEYPELLSQWREQVAAYKREQRDYELERAHNPVYLDAVVSTVSRRLSVVAGFYRICVIDQILTHSPADYVRRPVVPPESPTLGLSHLQFEALITTARLVALGAVRVRLLPADGDNESCLVMQDIEANEFCLD
jgi:site-specific recombinase XerD